MFVGIDGMTWWEGVVEDNKDPLKVGRLRVRIFGIHTPRKAKGEQTGIPTDELLWAHPVMPLTGSSVSGVGETPRVVNGTWVWGWFRDGANCQSPIVAGTIPGIPKKGPNVDKGFNDPDGQYPREDYIGESDLNRLARNENIEDTVVQQKRDSIVTVETADGEWTEPETPYNAEYPYNQVKESESGHIIELDDTPEAERVHIFHRSGTFIEVHPDGSVVKKIKGDGFDIIEQDGRVLIKGNADITVEGNSTLYVKSDITIKIDGSETKEIGEDLNINIEGDVTQQINGEVTQTINGDTTQILNQDFTQSVSGNYSLDVGGSYSINVSGNKSESISGTASRTAQTISDNGSGATVVLAGSASIGGSTINLN